MSARAAELRLRRRVLAASVRLVVFDLDDYLALNADVAEDSPLQHFARCGVWERRRCILPETCPARVGMAAKLVARPAPLDAATVARGWRVAGGLAVNLRVPSTGGSCATSALVGGCLSDVGARVRFLDNGDSLPSALREVEILMDAAGVFDGARPQGETADRLGEAVIWVGGPPGSATFEAALPYALGAAGVICGEAETYAVLTLAGLATVWLEEPPHDLASVDRRPEGPLVAALGRSAREAPRPPPWSERTGLRLALLCGGAGGEP